MPSDRETPLFSVLIPTHNRKHLVGQTIDSVLAQTCSDCEVIVIDDGSTDGTLDLLQAYGSRIRLLTQAKSGPEEARRKAIGIARGKYCVLLDSDDLLFPWALEVYRILIVEFGQPGLVIGRLNYFLHGQEPLKQASSPDCVEAFGYDNYLAKDVSVALSSSNIVARRSVLVESGVAETSFDAFPLDTFHYILFAGHFPGCAIIESPATVAYRRHSSNAILNTEAMLAGIRRLIEAERTGVYPGGRRHRSGRLVCIGGIAAHWVWEAFRRRKLLRPAMVLLQALPMIARALLRLVSRRFRPRPVPLRIPLSGRPGGAQFIDRIGSRLADQPE